MHFWSEFWVLILIHTITCYPQGFESVPSYISSDNIGQIIPTGKPWPAKAEDYASFSQTTRRYEAPVWAKTKPATTKTPVKYQTPKLQPYINPETSLLSSNDGTGWSRPMIIFYQGRKNNKIKLNGRFPEEEDKISFEDQYSSSNEDSNVNDNLNMKGKDPEKQTDVITEAPMRLIGMEEGRMLFTSSPIKNGNKNVLNFFEEPSFGVSNVAALIPEDMPTIIKRPKNGFL